ncbi:MAG: phosphoribosylformylglycinamidine synthase subunit PurS [Methanobacteriota archaeon]|nr:MAG: phosphoribosylformylglycinamidine synthase subunit PurS [Euryarchaeota archaeon]
MAVAEVRITLKKGVADPEGRNTLKALELLGFKGVRDVRTLKVFEIEVEGRKKDAEKKVEEMCRKLLANPVIHNYSISVR